MVYIKLFQTEQEQQACTEKQEYVSYTVESDKVNIMNLPFFCKLTLNNGEVVEIEGSGELTNAMIIPYSATTVSAEIGNLCTSIGDEAFSYYNEETGEESVFNLLTTVDISNSVTSIGFGAFNDCTSLLSITIPDSVTSIGQSVFYGCTSLSSITIPNSVTSIGFGAFYVCSSLSSITIPNGVTSIGDTTFIDCYSLSSITIPNSVTSIGNWAFYNCTSLTSITIPDSVTSIGDGAFAGCSGLTSITSLATTAPTIADTTFGNVKDNGTLYVPQGSSGYDAWLSALPGDWTKVEQ